MGAVAPGAAEFYGRAEPESEWLSAAYAKGSPRFRAMADEFREQVRWRTGVVDPLEEARARLALEQGAAEAARRESRGASYWTRVARNPVSYALPIGFAIAATQEAIRGSGSRPVRYGFGGVSGLGQTDPYSALFAGIAQAVGQVAQVVPQAGIVFGAKGAREQQKIQEQTIAAQREAALASVQAEALETQARTTRSAAWADVAKKALPWVGGALGVAALGYGVSRVVRR
jgi:hypothetical protein